ncbi:MBL fold metallo-hydrolase [Nocardia aobensis]|uniref:MBL fold metallo-hydrolase n=1 Tax=Nocardia aobensis TaxID=257277 RepID=A0ABW6PF36_9NOCA
MTTLDSGHTVEISDGIYAFVQPDGSWMINNSGFVVGRSGVLCIDACATQQRTEKLLASIAAVTPAPVRTLVNTHHHPDHTAGNGFFPAATIVAHEQARPEMRALGLPANDGIWSEVEYGDLELALPFLTFTDRITVWADDLRCEVIHAGQTAHTTNDAVVWIPERSVLFAGDLLFNGGTPFLLSGSVRGSIAVLEEFVAPLGAQTIVPGHGPVCGPEVIDEVLAYLRFLLDLADRGQSEGLSPLELSQQTDLGRFAHWTDTERIVGNLHRAYAENSGSALDFGAALRDMVTYNGGQPLQCLA